MIVRRKPGGSVAADSRRSGYKRLQRGTILLPIVLACFLGSIVVRLVSGTGAALAQEIDALIPDGANGATPVLVPDCAPDADLAPILERVVERESRVAAAEHGLEERLGVLAAAEGRITTRLAELKAAESALADTMAQTATAAEDDLARLTAVYETMKPKEAAKLFDAMVPEFAAGFLARMRTDAAGSVLSGMSPDKAYAVSVILAGRNATVPVPPSVAQE